MDGREDDMLWLDDDEEDNIVLAQLRAGFKPI